MDQVSSLPALRVSPGWWVGRGQHQWDWLMGSWVLEWVGWGGHSMLWDGHLTPRDS